MFRNDEIFKKYSFQIKNIVKDNSEYLRIFHLLKWVFQNYLFIYLMDMCWNGQITTVCVKFTFPFFLQSPIIHMYLPGIHQMSYLLAW